jgi:hypothetical protein
MLGNAAPGSGLRAHGRGPGTTPGWREVSWRQAGLRQLVVIGKSLKLDEFALGRGLFVHAESRKWCGCRLRPAARGF